MRLQNTISLLASAAFSLVTFAPAQGPLTPPGPPEPSLKTLQQVEPRTDIATVAGSATATHAITEPGSYYLSGNIDVSTTNGIEILASGVTLDLNGFAIYRVSVGAPLGRAIGIDGDQMDIRVVDGNIRGEGFAYGVGLLDFVSKYLFNCYIGGLNVSQPAEVGIDLRDVVLATTPEDNTIVENCHVTASAGIGIDASIIRSSTAVDCAGIAILGRDIKGSTGHSTGSSGIVGVDVGRSRGRTEADSGRFGISCGGNVVDSVGTADGTSGTGISATHHVINCRGRSNSGTGITSLLGNVTGSTGSTGPGNGIEAFGGNVIGSTGDGFTTGILASGNVQDSVGRCGSSGNGIETSEGSVQNSTGTSSSSGDGIVASKGNVQNSVGESRTSGIGINAPIGAVTSSRGVSNSNYGIFAFSVDACTAISTSGDAIRGSNVTNCFAQTTSGNNAIFAFGTVANCRAQNPSLGGDAIEARIISASTAVSGNLNASVAKVDGTP